MSPSELKIVKALVVVAWADGTVKEPEQGMLDGLLWAFGATDEQEAEIREFAKEKRTLKDDIPADALSDEERELLLAHAAQLTHADGSQSKAEKKLLDSLIELLGFTQDQAKPIIANAKDRAKSLSKS